MAFVTVSKRTLDIYSLANVLESCQDCAVKWNPMGLHFGVSHPRLEEIAAVTNDPRERLQRVLVCWLQKDTIPGSPDPSYYTLCHAVAEAGGNPALARKIAQEHPASTADEEMASDTSSIASSGYCTDDEIKRLCSCGDCSVQKIIAEGCPAITSDESLHRFPLLDIRRVPEHKKEEYIFKLMKETHSMNKEFDVLCKMLCKALQGVPVAILKAHLRRMKWFDQAVDSHNLQDKLDRCEDVNSVFDVLAVICSWFNHHPLESLVESFEECAEVKSKYDDFISNTLMSFLKRNVREVPKDGFGDIIEGSGQFQLKIPSNDAHDNIKAEHLYFLRGSIAEALNLPMGQLHILDLKEGCIEVTFMVPQVIYNELFPLSDEHCQALEAITIPVDEYETSRLISIHWHDGERNFQVMPSVTSSDSQFDKADGPMPKMFCNIGEESKGAAMKTFKSVLSETVEVRQDLIRQGVRLLVVGITGTGKSSLINSIMEKPIATEGDNCTISAQQSFSDVMFDSPSLQNIQVQPIPLKFYTPSAAAMSCLNRNNWKEAEIFKTHCNFLARAVVTSIDAVGNELFAAGLITQSVREEVSSGTMKATKLVCELERGLHCSNDPIKHLTAICEILSKLENFPLDSIIARIRNETGCSNELVKRTGVGKCTIYDTRGFGEGVFEDDSTAVKPCKVSVKDLQVVLDNLDKSVFDYTLLGLRLHSNPKDRKVFSAFRKHRRRLARAVETSLGEIAHELFAAGLITRSVCKEVSSGAIASQKATKLVRELERGLHCSEDPIKHLTRICEILSELENFPLDSIIARIRNETGCSNEESSSTGRGFAIIFNNTTFRKRRVGSTKDAEDIRETFLDRGYTVVVFNDCTADMIRSKLSALQTDCYDKFRHLFVFFLTHRNRSGIYGTDGNFICFDEIQSYLKSTNCPSFCGKPKVLIFQTCRTEGEQDGSSNWPIEEDFLLAFGSQVNSPANEHGSDFIQCLLATIRETADKEDLVSMLAIVTEKMRRCISQCDQLPEYHSSPIYFCQKKESGNEPKCNL